MHSMRKASSSVLTCHGICWVCVCAHVTAKQLQRLRQQDAAANWEVLCQLCCVSFKVLICLASV